MRRSTILRSAAGALAIALCAVSGVLRASGGDGFSENVFTPQLHVPLAELQGYAGGKLGVVLPSYWRVYQFLAYRALTGRALSKEELALLQVHGYSVGSQPDPYADDQNGVAGWLKARAAVHGAAEVKVGVVTDIGDYTMIVNCPSDAFDRAARTLAQRIGQGGQQWAAAWLAGQDAVFANCSPRQSESPMPGRPAPRPLTLPPTLPSTAPAWLVKDAAYQRAAAQFYGGRYEEARAGFLAIAKDPASPWQQLGGYLAARALIRATMAVPAHVATPERSASERERLLQARAEMAAAATAYAPARSMLTWIDVRVRPDERRRELSAALAGDPIGAASPQMLTDYLFLMDRLSAPAMAAAADPMTAWIGVMQVGSASVDSEPGDAKAAKAHLAALAQARTQWTQRHEAVWLLALLTNALGGELAPAEAKAAAAVKRDAPAYVGLQYHLARLALAEGRVKEADAGVTALLAQPQAASVRNRLLRMKMVTAATADAAFAAAARAPADTPAGGPIPDEATASAAATYDADLGTHLESHLPLAALVRLQPLVPVSERASLADLMWTRAVLLGQYALADGYTDTLARERATTRPLYERYKNAATPAAKRDAALLVLANAPELTPHVSPLQRTDGYGSYWSCAMREAADDGMDARWPAFVSAAERTQAEAEMGALRKLPKRSSYLIPLVIAWAKQNKADPEAPKALHFLVAATRNECGTGAREAQAHNYSKDAFDFLHAQYPKSEWTAKTRYYY